MTIQRMCELAGVSRASFYRDWEQKAPAEAELALRDAAQRTALKDRSLGYRRITALLQRAGFVVGREKVRRILRTDNLLAVRRRKFVATTDSNHRFRVAVVLDAFSRKVIGWELGRSLAATLPLRALEAAIASRQPKPGLVHHSDRGTQYASNEYVTRLEASSIHVSMSRAGRPWENGKCESFIRTLKREEIDARAYGSLEELHDNLAEFLEQIYNVVRLHSALGYRSPQEVEEEITGGAQWSPGALSFPRHEEIYPDV